MYEDQKVRPRCRGHGSGRCSITFFAPTPAAQAYAFLSCGRFGETSVTYDTGIVLDYLPRIEAAIDAWNDKGSAVPGAIKPSSSTAGAHIFFYRISSSFSYWAATEGDCNSNGNWKSGDVSIQLNDATMTALANGQRRRVIEHEIGHAYGLAHMPSGCSATHAVMVQGESKWNCGWTGVSPWADDVNGVAAIY